MSAITRSIFSLIVISLATCAILAQGGGRPTGPATPKPSSGGGRAPKGAKLTIVSDPGNCQVSINGKSSGQTDEQGQLVLDLPPARYKVRVARDGFVQQERNVSLQRGGAREQFFLPPTLVSMLVVTDPPDAEVYVDGGYRGTTRSDGMLTVEGIKMGDHVVRIQRRGYLTEEQPAKIASSGAPVRIKLTPDPISQRVQVVDQHLSSGRLAEAFSVYGELYDSKPSHPDLPPALDRILEHLQARTLVTLRNVGTRGLTMSPDDVQELRRLYQLAKKFKPDDSGIAIFLDYWDAKFYFGRARTSLTSGEGNDSIQQGLSALARLNSAGIRNAYLLYDIGWLYSAMNDRGQALRNFYAAQSADGSWSLPIFAIGLVEMSAADQLTVKKDKKAGYERALANFNQAIALNPRFYEAFALRGIAFAGLGKNREAVASGEQAVAINSQSGFAHFALGYIYFQKGKSEYPNADREFAAALSATVDPLDADARKRTQGFRTIIANRK